MNDAAYPPPGHVLRLLGVRIEPTEAGVAVRFPVGPHLRHRSGALQTGLLATAVDVAGGVLSARTVAPDWIATATLELDHRRVAPTGTGEVAVTAEVIRAGRTLVVLGHRVHDDDGILADGTMTFTRLARRPGNPTVTPPPAPDEGGDGGDGAEAVETDGDGGSDAADDNLIGVAGRQVVTFAADEPPASLRDHVGLRVGDDGAVSLPLTDTVRNSLGAVQGGMLGLCADVAAEQAGRAVLGRPARTLDLAIDYVRVANRGPVRATAEVVRAGLSTARCRVVLVDEGADRLAATATATVEAC